MSYIVGKFEPASNQSKRAGISELLTPTPLSEVCLSYESLVAKEYDPSIHVLPTVYSACILFVLVCRLSLALGSLFSGHIV